MKIWPRARVIISVGSQSWWNLSTKKSQESCNVINNSNYSDEESCNVSFTKASNNNPRRSFNPDVDGTIAGPSNIDVSNNIDVSSAAPSNIAAAAESAATRENTTKNLRNDTNDRANDSSYYDRTNDGSSEIDDQMICRRNEHVINVSDANSQDRREDLLQERDNINSKNGMRKDSSASAGGGPNDSSRLEDSDEHHPSGKTNNSTTKMQSKKNGNRKDSSASASGGPNGSRTDNNNSSNTKSSRRNSSSNTKSGGRRNSSSSRNNASSTNSATNKSTSGSQQQESRSISKMETLIRAMGWGAEEVDEAGGEQGEGEGGRGGGRKEKTKPIREEGKESKGNEGKGGEGNEKRQGMKEGKATGQISEEQMEETEQIEEAGRTNGRTDEGSMVTNSKQNEGKVDEDCEKRIDNTIGDSNGNTNQVPNQGADSTLEEGKAILVHNKEDSSLPNRSNLPNNDDNNEAEDGNREKTDENRKDYRRNDFDNSQKIPPMLLSIDADDDGRKPSPFFLKKVIQR